VVTRLDQRSYSTSAPISAWMGDRLRAGKLSRYVTSYPGQLSLAIPPWVGTKRTYLGWEGNRRSGVAMATIVIYPPTDSTAYIREMSTPPTLLLGYGTHLPFTW